MSDRHDDRDLREDPKQRRHSESKVEVELSASSRVACSLLAGCCPATQRSGMAGLHNAMRFRAEFRLGARLFARSSLDHDPLKLTKGQGSRKKAMQHKFAHTPGSGLWT